MESKYQLSRIAKVRNPLASATLTVKLHGVYSLPQQWKDAEPPEAQYQLIVSGVQFDNGRYVKRELTEEEIKAAEENKRGGKNPPAKRGQVVEPTAEELEQQEKERLEKEEKQRAFEEMWSKLSEEDRFYYQAEDIYQNPFIVWEQESEEDDRKFKTYEQFVEKTGETLILLEEQIELDGVIKVQFARLPKAQEEDNKRKKKPTEEIKPLYAKGLLNVESLKEPGSTEIIQRVSLIDAEEAEVPFFTGESYVYLQVNINPPITYQTPQKLPQGVQDFIPPKPPLPRFQPSINAVHDFTRQVKLAVKAIAAEYHNMFGGQIQSEGNYTNMDAREKRKEQFLYEFNISGKSQVLKNKLRKSVVKITKERIPELKSLKGLSFNENDKFYSELYSFLVEKMQESSDELFTERKKLLHQDLTVPKHVLVKEKQEFYNLKLGESYTDRLSRLSNEAEMILDLDKAQKYIQEKIELNSRDPSAWEILLEFSLRQQDYLTAQESLSEIIGILGQQNTIEHLVKLAAILLSQDKFEEAKIAINGAIEIGGCSIIVYSIAWLTYKLSGDGLLEQKFFAHCVRKIKVKLGKEQGEVDEFLQAAVIRETEEDEEIGPKQIDDMLYIIIDYLFELKIILPAQKLLEQIQDQESSANQYNLYQALTIFWSKDYEKASEFLNEILQFDPRNPQMWIYIGHSYYFQQQFDLALQCYLKSIRYASRIQTIDLTSVFLRLGDIYRSTGQYKEAKQVYLILCEKKATSLGWLGLGVSCFHLEQYQESYEALMYSNLLDDTNSTVWGYMALLCTTMDSNNPGLYIQSKQCLYQGIKYGLKDEFIFKNIGYMWLERFLLQGINKKLDKYDYSDSLYCLQLVMEIRKKEDNQDLVDKVNEIIDKLSSIHEVSLDLKICQNLENVRTKLVEEILEY